MEIIFIAEWINLMEDDSHGDAVWKGGSDCLIVFCSVQFANYFEHLRQTIVANNKWA